MPTLFEELVINGKWDIYNFIEWNLAIWVNLFFGPGVDPANRRLYPPNFKAYIATCLVCSCALTCFYMFYLICYYIWYYIRSLLFI